MRIVCRWFGNNQSTHRCHTFHTHPYYADQLQNSPHAEITRTTLKIPQGDIDKEKRKSVQIEQQEQLSETEGSSTKLVIANRRVPWQHQHQHQPHHHYQPLSRTSHKHPQATYLQYKPYHHNGPPQQQHSRSTIKHSSLPHDYTSYTPKHDTIKSGFRRVAEILKDFMLGGKQLWSNVKQSSVIREQLRKNPHMGISRASQRHLNQTKADVIGGAVIIIAFWIPFVGNLIPLVAYFLPRHMPTVLVTQERRYGLICEDAPLNKRLLRELHSHITDDGVKQQLQHINSPTQLSSLSSALTSLSWSALSRDHALSLLQYLHYRSIFHTLSPVSSYLIRDLQRWCQDITADDALIRSESYGIEMNLQQLTEACHERGIYPPLLSTQYQTYIRMLTLKKRGVVINDEEQKYTEGELTRVLLEAMTAWLQWTEKEKDVPCMLLLHAGVVLSSYVSVVQSRNQR